MHWKKKKIKSKKITTKKTNVPCWKEKQFMQAVSKMGPSRCLGFWNSPLVQILSQFKATLHRGRASSKDLLLIKRSPHHRQLNSYNYSWNEPLTGPTELLNTSQRSAILETDKPLDIWLSLLLSDLLCYIPETLKNCNLSFVVDVIVIVFIAVECWCVTTPPVVFQRVRSVYHVVSSMELKLVFQFGLFIDSKYYYTKIDHWSMTEGQAKC